MNDETRAILLRAADLIEAGWSKGGDTERKSGTVCAIEALAAAAGGGWTRGFREAKLALTYYVRQPLLTWNYQSPSSGRVSAAMRKLAEA